IFAVVSNVLIMNSLQLKLDLLWNKKKSPIPSNSFTCSKENDVEILSLPLNSPSLTTVEPQATPSPCKNDLVLNNEHLVDNEVEVENEHIAGNEVEIENENLIDNEVEVENEHLVGNEVEVEN
ncbi:unnamed protein product, partial [Rotaria sp. Silwood2]